MNKNLMIGLGVLAVAGIAYYMYNKPKATEKKSEARGISGGCTKALCDDFCKEFGGGQCDKGGKGCICNFTT